MWFLRHDGEWYGKRWFSFLVQDFVPCCWCSCAGAVAGMVVLRLLLLAPLLAEAAFFFVHDMAPSLVMKLDGEDSVEGLLPEVLFGSVSAGAGRSAPLLRWLLVVLVCDFVFFWAPHGFCLVWVDERDFDVSFKAMFGAPDLVFLIKQGLAAAMLAAPLGAMRWSMPACSRICPPCSQSSLMLPLHAACFAAFLWPHRHTNLVVPYSWWKESGIGKGKGEKKAGYSKLCLGLWLVLLPFQVVISSLAAASEAAYVRYLHIRLRLLFPQVRLLFDRGKW